MSEKIWDEKPDAQDYILGANTSTYQKDMDDWLEELRAKYDDLDADSFVWFSILTEIQTLMKTQPFITLNYLGQYSIRPLITQDQSQELVSLLMEIMTKFDTTWGMQTSEDTTDKVEK